MTKTIVVSAFFHIPSKQPYSFYRQHLLRWFRSIQCQVIFFTSTDVHDDIISFGFDLKHIKFVIMSCNDFNAWKLGTEFWQRQKERDVETYHTPEVAAIWFEKKEFVKRAFALCDADVFIWCDAGCVRNDASETALKYFGTRNTNINDGCIHVQHIRSQEYKKYYVYPDSRFAAAIIAGNRYAWEKLYSLYNVVLKEYDDNGISCNSDQYILATCYDKKPDMFVTHSPQNNDIDMWFFFLNLL